MHTEGIADIAEPLARCARVEVLKHTLSGRLGPPIGGQGLRGLPVNVNRVPAAALGWSGRWRYNGHGP